MSNLVAWVIATFKVEIREGNPWGLEENKWSESLERENKKQKTKPENPGDSSF